MTAIRETGAISRASFKTKDSSDFEEMLGYHSC